jgi:hypothetical protein
MGYVKNSNQLIIKEMNFLENTNSSKVIGIEELQDQNLQVLFYEEDQIEDEGLKEAMVISSKFFPIRVANELSLTQDSFEKLENTEAQSVLSKVLSNWILQNNVTLLEELFPVVDHLNALWPNDRTAFFEELWFMLKNNLGASDIRVVYNDLKKIGKNDDKNTLIQVVVEGDKMPNPKEGSELEKKLMDNYKEEFVNLFSVVEYLPEKGQLVLAGSIKKSPFLVMANVTEFTRLQQSIISTFITALSR